MTPKMEQVLNSLRSNVEGRTEDSTGEIWGEVYIPNVGSSRVLAGVLSALSAEGLYKPIDTNFGQVKLRRN